jgi:hypothetical protein
MSTAKLEKDLTINSNAEAKRRLYSAIGQIANVAAQENFLSQAERESFASTIRKMADTLAEAPKVDEGKVDPTLAGILAAGSIK